MITYITHHIYTNAHTKFITEFISLSQISYCDADMLDVGTNINHNYYVKVHVP
jgi:hypothetical protein